MLAFLGHQKGVTWETWVGHIPQCTGDQDVWVVVVVVVEQAVWDSWWNLQPLVQC